ncbi:ABC transporter ATP-binding protein [Marinicella gelatinilytica]|uniref:ABC transporter ATP-binding protein n=1 Tax=Marinicella gelatinilytica TaxID=2996017 RepID=UPI002260E66F|nr:ATP-binding cassette domain-containing protein [Marinicella gelatinilytica]MCX7544107.1 ATP-binding cassette domain-containing protein [Marinicella gelatinilytica]
MTSQNHKTPDKVIEVTDLVTHYGTRKILDGMNFEVERGEIRVIMGGSGSGKSTLLWYILGLYKPTEGRIKVLGEDINQISFNEHLKLKQNIGVSFQSGALFSSMSVGENVAFPLREFTDLDENTIRIITRMKLEVVNLGGFHKLMPSQLSGGMIKRAALARAIVMDPKLLFFDEPSAGLDPVVASEIDDLILSLRDNMGMSMVVVTHELESAFKIADRITVLDQGKNLLTASVEEVKKSKNKRIMDLLQRRSRHDKLDPEEYLRRLTQENYTLS